jgi:hypothetical protein
MAHSILVERDIPAEMRDGVTLRADIYRPQTGDRLPVLLQRTPYGKSFSSNAFALMAAERGYAVVIQDTRGRWASEGDGYPLISEATDGYDSVEWAARQPWSSGKVGMFGGSYVGYTQWAAAAAQPPALKTIAPIFTFTNPHEVFYYSGAFALGMGVSWGLMAGAQMAILRHPNPMEKLPLMAQLIELADGMAQGPTFEHLPLKSLPLIGQGEIASFFYDVLTHPHLDDYWRRALCPLEKVAIPTLHIGGWYDTFTSLTTRDYNRLCGYLGSEAARATQKLILGPWVHTTFEGFSGEVDFGLAASWMLFLPDELHLRWFDYWLKGLPNSIMDEPPVRLFVMGENQWRHENEWPLARTQYTPYYLHSRGVANTFHGDGTLGVKQPSAEEPVDTFVYDPRNPVPTHGGGLGFWQAALQPGAYDQRKIETRPDILVYSSVPLDKDIEVTGPVKLRLWAASSAPDTDFTAKLVDVSPNGYARNVTDGILRASRRKPGEISLIIPGEVYEYTIELGETSNLFKAGHRIRIEVSSSNFPRFDRNLNTGGDSAETTDLEVAMQTIFHDAGHPSHLLLPIIPR